MTQLSLVGYHLTFDDEFSSASLFKVSSNGLTQFNDSYVFGNWLYNNSEAEYYVDPATGIVDPFSIANGALTITAQPTVAGEQTSGQPYTSGLLTTANSFTQNQGYFEIRCETPSTQGFWPAFWLLPTGGGGTPEIDVMEQPNLNGLSTYWTYARPGVTANNGGGWVNTNVNLSTTYNTYGVMWTPTSITFFFDGIQVGTTIAVPANFSQQMYMLVNLAVGGIGSWPGTPGATTTAQLNVDYLRVYSSDPTISAVPLQPVSSPDGVNTTPSYVAPASIVMPSLTTGPDVLSLFVSEDYWLNDAQFTVSIDGVQQGGTLTALAGHALGQSETFLFDGTFGATAHVVTVNFLNDAYGGSALQDVNLYVLGAQINGVAVSNSVLTETNNGPQSFTFVGTPAVVVTPPPVIVTPLTTTSTDVLTLQMAEIPGLADAQFTISVDGVQQGGIQTTTALQSLGQTQSFVVNGSFAVGANTVSVAFLNPTGTTAALGLNVASATLDGVAIAGAALSLTTATPQSFGFTEAAPIPPVVVPTGAAPVVVGSGPDTLALTISEDAYLGNAQFTVSINGVQQGGIQTALAADLTPYTPLLAQSQVFDIMGSFATSTDIVTVNFLNDLYGGSATADRNLYVLGAQLNGVTVVGSALKEVSAGPQSFNITVAVPAVVVVTPPPVVVTPPTVIVTPLTTTSTDVLTLQMVEIPGLADAQFTISVDGVQQGGIQTTTALQSLGQTQSFVVNGSFPAGANTVSVAFLNPTGTTAALGLNVASATLDGVAIAGAALSLTTAVPQSFGFTEPAPVVVTPPAMPALTVIGSGPDTLALTISEDAYLGNAQFTVSINGVQQGGIQTALAADLTPYTPLLAQSQVFDINGSFATGTDVVTVNFLNDLYGGSATADRNLYVLGAQLNGVAVAGSALKEVSAGPQSFNITVAAPPPVVVTPPPVIVTPLTTTSTDVLTLQMADIPGLAGAQFTISVDGVQQGGIQTTTALQSLGQTQSFVVNGSFAPGLNSASVAFLNPTGTAAAQGLNVISATLDGMAIAGSTLGETSSVAKSFSFTEPSLPTTVIGSGPDTLLLGISENAYLGNAQFTVSVDGVQQGGTQTAQASSTLGQSQFFAIDGSFGAGPHTVAVDLLNGLNAGTPATDRSLSITSLSDNGVPSAVGQASLTTSGTATLTANATPPLDTVTFALTENAFNGNAQVALSLDGLLLGSPSVTFLNPAGTSELFTYQGDFGGALLAHVATVNLLNDIAGSTPLTSRDVYVQSITFDSVVTPMLPTEFTSNGAVNYMLHMV